MSLHFTPDIEEKLKVLQRSASHLSKSTDLTLSNYYLFMPLNDSMRGQYYKNSCIIHLKRK
jgi:hypothetical protein